MREKFSRFMAGRYGFDQFSRFLLIAAIVVILLNSLIGNSIVSLILSFLGWFMLIYCYVRMFSRNTAQRYQENQMYLEKTAGIRNFFGKQKYRIGQSKDYHIYKCPGCKQKIRIPRGKGRIEVRCPKCGTTFIKKS